MPAKAGIRELRRANAREQVFGARNRPLDGFAAFGRRTSRTCESSERSLAAA
jgi:hypothetical protein